MLNPTFEARWRAASAFVATGAVAVIAGGFVAAGVGLSQRPLQHIAWMSAFLVLVAGVAQIIFGTGQAWLGTRVAGSRWRSAEWIVYNLGSAGVIAGTLLGSFVLVLAGTLLFAAGIALFLFGARGEARSRWLIAYRVLLILIFCGSLIGLVLTATGHAS